ncbi:MAG: Eco29kI family restriction endonuclease, partial [Rhodothermales bacterium]
MPDFDRKKFIEDLESIIDGLPPSDAYRRSGDHYDRKKLRRIVKRVVKFSQELDPYRHPRVHDPADPSVAGRHLANDLEGSESENLADLEGFWGSGIYALYYKGDHPAYVIISGADVPIYVGKANPSDFTATNPVNQGRKLYNRIREHRSSIQESNSYVSDLSKALRSERGLHSLAVSDFECSYLVVPSAYAEAAETVLIEHYKPVWNKETQLCEGIGKHGDSASTRANTRSRWDTIHPGRSWTLGENNID